ncbi:hypothetical protein LOD99_4930 [Oopsacas minuta]|uniref:Uncharacterized protein n=1 Tax=Oopsacas minuta TaxID=111878 RepID=A0AAV7JSB7_9METZ|nr:hypothetical protein LOD99_4930 [Oopsacas minuta]
MNNIDNLTLLSPSLQGVNFGFEKYELTNSYDHFIIDSTTGFLYILDDVSCNAKKFSIKVFSQDFHFQNSFQIPDNLHSISQDRGFASFGVNSDYIYFLNRTSLSMFDKYNFNTITRSVVNSRKDPWNRIFVGEQDNLCLNRTVHVPCKVKRLEMLILADIKYTIKRRFELENFNLHFVSMAYHSVFLLEENFSEVSNLLEISYDSKELRSISLGYTNEILAYTMTPFYIIILSTDSILSVFTYSSFVERKIHRFSIQLIQNEETDKMIYNINSDENSNSLFVYSPFYLTNMFIKYKLNV